LSNIKGRLETAELVLKINENSSLKGFLIIISGWLREGSLRGDLNLKEEFIGGKNP
jgi:hypothetical protein